MIEARLFTDLGGFDDRFAPAYFEDTDLCARCQQAGRRVVYQPRAIAIHVESGTSVRRADVEALLDRNRVALPRAARRLAVRAGSAAHGLRPPRRRPLRPARPLRRRPGAASGSRSRAAAGQHHRQRDGGPRLRRDGVLGLWRARGAGDDLPRSLDRIEVIEPCGREGFRRLVTERAGVYDVLWVSRPPHIRMVCEVLRGSGPDPAGGRPRPRGVRFRIPLRPARVRRRCPQGPAGAGPGPRPGDRPWSSGTIAAADQVVCVSPADARLLRRAGVAEPGGARPRPGAPSDPPGFAARSGLRLHRVPRPRGRAQHRFPRLVLRAGLGRPAGASCRRPTSPSSVRSRPPSPSG